MYFNAPWPSRLTINAIITYNGLFPTNYWQVVVTIKLFQIQACAINICLITVFPEIQRIPNDVFLHLFCIHSRTEDIDVYYEGACRTSGPVFKTWPLKVELCCHGVPLLFPSIASFLPAEAY